MLINSELLEFKNFCKMLSNESGKNIKKYFRTNIGIESKSDDSPVTIADKTTEEKLRELIMKEYPEHGILGEEFGQHNKDSEYQWVLDPIDGTKNFVCGGVIFGTLIALLKNNKPILGVFHQPILNEFMIGDNKTTLLNDKVVKVTDVSGIEEASLLVSDHLNVKEYQDLPKFENLMQRVKLYSPMGDCYGYYLLASGFAQIMIDPIMSVWDTMALIPIINGAGGIITDYQGKDALLGESVVASTPNIHKEVIRILNN